MSNQLRRYRLTQSSDYLQGQFNGCNIRRLSTWKHQIEGGNAASVHVVVDGTYRKKPVHYTFEEFERYYINNIGCTIDPCIILAGDKRPIRIYGKQIPAQIVLCGKVLPTGALDSSMAWCDASALEPGTYRFRNAVLTVVPSALDENDACMQIPICERIPLNRWSAFFKRSREVFQKRAATPEEIDAFVADLSGDWLLVDVYGASNNDAALLPTRTSKADLAGLNIAQSLAYEFGDRLLLEIYNRNQPTGCIEMFNNEGESEIRNFEMKYSESIDSFVLFCIVFR